MTSIAYSTGTMDLNPLIRLKDALEGAQKNTSKMLIKLEKFDTKLTTLEEKMQPLQVSTSHYTRAKENIALTLVEVNKTYEYFRSKIACQSTCKYSDKPCVPKCLR